MGQQSSLGPGVNSMGRITPLGAPFPLPGHGWTAWDPVCSWQGVPRQHFYPGSTDSTVTPGLRCPQHPQAAELGATGVTHSKCFTPQAFSAPNTPCTMLWFSFKEGKFCISSTGQAIQDLQKVSRVWIGKHSQNQQADGLSFWFTSPFYDCLACSASIYSQQIL